MRGEHWRGDSRAASARGSSPHARGAHGRGQGAGRAEGIIPACAGSTRTRTRRSRSSRDHPRMRGEHPPLYGEHSMRPGSSPHARGALANNSANNSRKRIIPACAGSTLVVKIGGRYRWDHPRMRGEHNGALYVGRPVTGSSPHARGAPKHRGVYVVCPRIIPACAGSTGRKLNLQSA